MGLIVKISIRLLFEKCNLSFCEKNLFYSIVRFCYDMMVFMNILCIYVFLELFDLEED